MTSLVCFDQFFVTVHNRRFWVKMSLEVLALAYPWRLVLHWHIGIALASWYCIGIGIGFGIGLGLGFSIGMLSLSVVTWTGFDETRQTFQEMSLKELPTTTCFGKSRQNKSVSEFRVRISTTLASCWLTCGPRHTQKTR